MSDTIKISEIFTSVQGEGPLTGVPTTFIRTQGCPYRCSWCDSKYTWDFNEVEEMQVLTVDEILTGIPEWPKQICITGGEPLTQPIGPLVEALIEDSYEVSIETSGLHKIPVFTPWRPRFVMDWKLPGSGEGITPKAVDRMQENLLTLCSDDIVKLVVATDEDFDYLKLFYEEWAEHCELTGIRIYASPVVGGPLLITKALPRFIIDNCMNVTVQYQLHKILEMR